MTSDELIHLRKLVRSIAAIEVDWMVGLIDANRAMKEISELLEKSKRDVK